MTTIGVRQLSLLALAAGMVVIGVAGLAGAVTLGPTLVAVLFLAALVLAFGTGRLSTRI